MSPRQTRVSLLKPLVAIVFLSVIGTTSRSVHAEESVTQSFFYIVSVPPPPGFEKLPSLSERADSLEEFITATYHPDSQHLIRMDQPDATTARSVRALLYEGIRQLPEGSMIFFFLLTHSELKDVDLRIVMSDSMKDDLAGTALHGSELILTLSKASKRSLVFAFLDSCESGGLGTPLNEVLGTIANNFLESKMFILTSSAAGEPSYAGNFTQALIDVWKAQGSSSCVRRDFFLDAIDKKLATYNQSQRAQVVVDFSGPCINFANQTMGLLVVWNTTRQPVTLVFPDDVGSIIILSSDKGPTLVSVPRSVRRAGVFRSTEPAGAITFDLSVNPVISYRVDQPLVAGQVAQEYIAISDRIEEFGFRREAQAYRALAAGFSRLSGDETRAKEIEVSIDRSVAPEEVVAALDYSKGLTLQGEDPERVGNFLVSLGRYQAANSVYFKAFHDEKDDPAVFGSFYTSLVLAGKESEAKKLRLDFPDLFKQSVEAQSTKVILNTANTREVAALHGLTSAAERAGLIVTQE